MRRATANVALERRPSRLGNFEVFFVSGANGRHRECLDSFARYAFLKRLDTRAPGTASGANQEPETVGAVNGATTGSGSALRPPSPVLSRQRDAVVGHWPLRRTVALGRLKVTSP